MVVLTNSVGLAASSSRINLFTMGKSTQSKDIIYSVISSPEKFANFEKYEADRAAVAHQ